MSHPSHGAGGGQQQQRHGSKRDSHSQHAPSAAASSASDSASKRPRSSALPSSRPSASSAHAPTVRDLITDTLAPLANSYWAPGAPRHEPFDARIIEVIYATHLAPTNAKAKEREAMEQKDKAEKEESKDAAGAAEDSAALRALLAEEEAEQSTLEAQRSQRLLLLELSAYLENYLWKHYDPSTSTFAHVLSIVMLVNQKFNGENRVGIWEPFHSRPVEVFVALLERIARLKTERDLSMLEANQLLLFFIHAFESFEEPAVRKVFMKLASVDCWRTLRDSSVLRVLRTTADGDVASSVSQAEGDLRAAWKKVCAKPSTDFSATFLPNLLSEFVHILYAIDDAHRMFRLNDAASNRRARRLPYAVRDHLVYLERFLEFVIGLVAKLSTRRWAKKLVEEIHLIVICQQSTLVRRTREKEKEIATKQAEMAARGSKSSGSDAMDLEALSASTASAGGAILSMDNYSNTNAALSASALPGRLFCQLLDLLQSVLHFEIDDVSGAQLGAQEVLNRHYLDIQILQKICFKFFQHVPQLLNVALANVSRLDNEQQLRDMLQGLSREQLRDLCIRMQLLPRDEEVEEYKKAAAVPASKKGKSAAAAAPAAIPRLIVPLLSYMQSSSFLLSLLLSTFVLRPSTRSTIDSMPLYPSETLLFDETSIPSQNYTGETCLALPKLNLQFLTIHDYLTRNFQLYKGESTYEIREDIAYTLKRLKPRVGTDGSTVFTGWARMSCPLMSFAVTSVAKPLIGETKPASVRAEITIDLSVFNGIVREEWEQLRQHDVLFLLSVQALTPISHSSGNAAMLHSRQTGDGADRAGRRKADMDGLDLEGGVAPEEAFAALASEQLFVKFVRGAEVKSVLDGHKKIIGERDEKGNVYKARGSIRTYRVELDAAQYGLDQRAEIEGAPCFGGAPVSQVYSSFNLLLRRKAKENNFRSVLETIRNLMSDSSAGQAVLPPWLERVFLGYGDPKESQYYRLPNQLPRIEFIDTFLDLQHLRDSFAENVSIAERSSEEIEAELKGERQMNLVALGGEANNRQTAASTSIQLTRQVMRLVAQAQKEKTKSSGADATAAAASATPAEPTDSTFRVSFPLQVEPNYEVLQHLLYARGAGSLDAPKQSAEEAGVDFILREGEETLKAITKENDDEEEEEEAEEEAVQDEETEEGEIEEGEIDEPMEDAASEAAAAPAAPVLPELVAPPAFKLKAPAKFTMQEPTKPVAEAAAASSAAAAASPAAAAASSSADVEAEITALHSLTVAKLKDLMKPLGLSLVGVKAVLIERLSESMRESAKAAPAAAADSAMTDAPAAASSSAPAVSAEATAAYEADLVAYRAAQAAHVEEQAAFDAARKEHEAAVAAYESALAAQKQTLKEHAAAVKTSEKAHKKPSSAKKSSPAKSKKKASPAKAKSKSSSGKKKSSKKAATSAASAVAASSAPAAAPAFVIPASPHTLSVELLPRVSSRTDYTRRNPIRFTPVQVEAIKSGLNPGLTMIVGPPGTGKTDTAVQIISELYHNFPEQRTLLITHSNHALNDLFEKIMLRDIDERYLLRLGRGSDELATESDMGKFGRVNFMLARRLTLLEEVASLARSLNMADDVAYTCETAGHFFLAHILARWEKFTSEVQASQKGASNAPPGLEASVVSAAFPFTAYFATKQEKQRKIWEAFYGVSQQEPTADAAAPASATGAASMDVDEKSASASSAAAAYVAATAAAASSNSLFPGRSLSEDMSLAVSCFADLQKTFVELEETRPFELLRSYKDRSNYLLTKHAKIIAMTCTHAAIMRGNLVDLGFAFDNVVMEESAQILEIETFIPLLLQRADQDRGSRLQRVILLGDHHQLPPVIANRAFQKYSHLDQSLFTRFIRLGMPYIQLNAQGRMRPSLANLWNWKYQSLGNLPVIRSNPSYQFGNPGLRHEFQMIDVADLNGVGESSPTPFFYQNLGEAEYIVQLYMYMRLLGYAANRISILTTYNGQKHLIREILEQRCARNPLFGMPNKVSTVDKFQGQQNDFILLSLVRTRTAGHLRDVRRLVVAMSRARLGLYLFGRVSLFTNCFELTRTFNQLLQKPVKLQILPQEKRPMDQPLATERLAGAEVDPHTVLEVRDVVHMGELVASMTLSVQSEFGEYHRRIQAAQEEERIKREQQEQLRRQYEEAREATRREDARLAMQATRDAQHQREQEALDREMALEQAEQPADAAPSASPISEDDSDDEA